MKQFFAVLVALWSFTSNATQIDVFFDNSAYKKDDNVLASLWLSDYNGALTYFGFDVMFDPDELSFIDAEFSTALDIENNPSFPFLFLDGSTLLVSNLFTSLVAEDVKTLMASQGGKPLKLITFNFTALTTLAAPKLEVTYIDYLFETPDQAPVLVTDPKPVPVPATALLLLPALLLLRRRA